MSTYYAPEPYLQYRGEALPAPHCTPSAAPSRSLMKAKEALGSASSDDPTPPYPPSLSGIDALLLSLTSFKYENSF